jgi:hypothetical protein
MPHHHVLLKRIIPQEQRRRVHNDSELALMNDNPGRRKLQYDQNDETKNGLRDRDIFRQNTIGERRSQGHGYDQVEGIPLRQRPWAGTAQTERSKRCK